MVWAVVGRTGGEAPAGEGEGGVEGCRRGMGARHADNRNPENRCRSPVVVGAAAVCCVYLAAPSNHARSDILLPAVRDGLCAQHLRECSVEDGFGLGLLRKQTC